MIQGEQLRKQAEELLAKATRSNAAARRHMEDRDYDFASSRAYYAVFYAMQAALVTKNLAFTKHSGVISAFNEHFLKVGTFPKEFSKLITRLFRDRQIGDYETDVSIGETDATDDIFNAESVVRAIEKHLREHIL